ncbi:MAG: DUF1926 domain-containing protein [Deltaproteobacteria bacterium]|nr:DUF1926 domain-containing protein [Deltaproteobacteria bacterium]
MTYFIFCIHNHQPAGNFPEVIEAAYESSYGPFLKAISKHPSIKLTIHTSGFLLDWIVENRPEYIELLKSMVERGQAEVMGGGYYEPILQVIPQADRLNQITMMSDKLEEVFGFRPRGIWLAERVWEPELPTTLKKAGMEYILVDDYHFIKSGLTREELGGYYVTEDQGNVIKVFPGSEALRYLIPFKPVDALEAHLRGLKGFLKRGDAAIYGDDGEKFGVWPGTAKWVFDEGWLEGFFAWMEKNLHWLKPVKMGEYIESAGPVGRVYLPATSYMEMGEWSLPATASREYGELVEEARTWERGEEVRRFFQGGTWRNFFSKYPEANWMHKRMLLASQSLRERAEGRQWDEGLADAERHLFKSQCNDAYWHGVFGGLYLPHLRTEVYRNLIEAEKLASIEQAHSEGPSITVIDMDADGFDEVIIRNRELNLFVSPDNGGSLVELDFKPRAVNLSNTLSRWFEGYHHKLEKKGKTEGDEGAEGTRSIHDVVLVKEEGLERYLKYDTARRVSLVDRFLSSDVTLDSIYCNKYNDLGDFSNNRYNADVRGASLVLSREGEVRGGRVSIAKEIIPGAHNSFKVNYRMKNLSSRAGACRFAVEMNFILPCCDGPACLYQMTPPVADIGLGSRGEVSGVEKVGLIDTYTGVGLSIASGPPATLWRFPVHTVSLSEGGFEKIYQGACLTFLYPISLDTGGEEFEVSFDLLAEEIT